MVEPRAVEVSGYWRWRLAGAVTGAGFALLNLSDRLAGEDYRGDLLPRRCHARVVAHLGHFFYVTGCRVYGCFLREEGVL